MEKIRLMGSFLDAKTELNRREWLITNGIGGFAGSSLSGLLTRGYHGMLIAALKPPLERKLLVSQVQEKVVVSTKDHSSEYQLGSNLYPDRIDPHGYQYLTTFAYGFHPEFIYEIDGRIIVKKIYMIYQENTTIIEYLYLDGQEKISLHISPFLNYRDYHGHLEANDWPWEMEHHGLQYKFTPFTGAHPIYMTCRGSWQANPHWHRGLFYPIEEYRGLKSVEDHFVPGSLRFDLKPGERTGLIFSTEEKYLQEVDLKKTYHQEVERISQLLQQAEARDVISQRLVVAADQFLTRRKSTKATTIIAGYPWFTDWGRDSMIALPGLTLVTGRWQEAKEIIQTFAQRSYQGLIPNRFLEEDDLLEYNTVDATLWFFIAIYEYYQKTGDQKLIFEYLAQLQEMLAYHSQGTLWGIKMDRDGLLTQGASGVQLTWMDAKVGDWVVTPRQGKAVEINALWYNCLRIVASFTELVRGKAAARYYEEQASQVLSTFLAKFWNQEGEYLYDRIDGDFSDPKIRPNQIFALSLPFPLLSRDLGCKVLKVVKEHLLTPYGLRSLSPKDNQYHGVYGGNQHERDAAYHQGTVWSWLLGPYLGALWYVEGGSKKTKEKIQKLLEPLLAHLETDGAIGQISEIFEGDRPFKARGCYAQAWSVAEILRIRDLISENVQEVFNFTAK